MTQGSRISRARIVGQLKLAAHKGDRVALALATDQMKTWAYSPRYWEKYLQLLRHPLARLVDLLLIKQGERIARQKGWVKTRREPAPAPAAARPRARRQSGARVPAPIQSLLFPDLVAAAAPRRAPPRRARVPR